MVISIFVKIMLFFSTLTLLLTQCCLNSMYVQSKQLALVDPT